MKKHYQWTILLLLFCFLTGSSLLVSQAANKKDAALYNFSKPKKDTLLNSTYDTNQIRILIIGNSLVRRNHSAAMLEKMLKISDYTPYVETVLKSGASMRRFTHKDNLQGRRVYQLLKNQNWDYVILQDSLKTVFSRKKKMKPHVEALKEMAEASGAKIALFLPWAPQEGHLFYSKKHFPSNEEEFYSKTAEKYAKLQKEFQTLLIPSGRAFHELQKTYPGIDPYCWDLRHPSLEGSYLSACCMYMTITGKSPQKLTYHAGISSGTAKKLQKIAYQVCIMQKMAEVNQVLK